jgi:hypothetical protein
MPTNPCYLQRFYYFVKSSLKMLDNFEKYRILINASLHIHSILTRINYLIIKFKLYSAKV